MNLEMKIYEKEGFIFTRIKKNHYKINFGMENNNIFLSNTIDFNLIQLIYSLNQDVYEKVELEIINENKAIAIFLFKNFFEEIGFSQKFSYLNIEKVIQENKIIFHSKNIPCIRPHGIPFEAEEMEIENMSCVVEIITNHKVNFEIDITYPTNVVIPTFAEKIVGIILYKIFNRVKQFIEKIHI